jgi:superfamily II DNA helicase RecQ
LYYSYKDKKVLESMIRKSAPSPNSQSTRRKIDQLYTCVKYCEDEFRCRRTMQLEFFGEDFDRSKCHKTCDNCRTGKEAEQRDMTNEAMTIICLLTDIQSQKKGRGVTMLQVSDLYKGSKGQSATKFLNTARLTGYGAGSKMKKGDIDRITHAMVFNRLLVEESVANGGGFSSDYVSLAENAAAVQNGQRRFFVEFPKACAKGKENAATVSTKQTKTKAASAKKPRKKLGPSNVASANSLKNSEAEGGLTFIEVDDNSDQEDDLQAGATVRGSKPIAPSTLPYKHNKALVEKIKTLTQVWAEEERLLGNSVFCKFVFGGHMNHVDHVTDSMLTLLCQIFRLEYHVR